MKLVEKINRISEDSRNKFKPDLIKYGKNFRAISESAILDVLSPLLEENGLCYSVTIFNTKVEHILVNAGTDVAGNIIQKLVFVASASVRLDIKGEDEEIAFEGWGMGIDSGDKATGKAITAATKYALLKGFRLQYSDDPDATASEDIESLVTEAAAKKEAAKKEAAKKEFVAKMTKAEEEKLATEGQINYIMGLASTANLSDEDFKKKFGVLPYDKNMTMKRAREIIDALKPF